MCLLSFVYVKTVVYEAKSTVVCEHFTMLKGRKSWDSWVCLCIHSSNKKTNLTKWTINSISLLLSEEEERSILKLIELVTLTCFLKQKREKR